jgi:hypothetical protein
LFSHVYEINEHQVKYSLTIQNSGQLFYLLNFALEGLDIVWE